MGVCHSAAKDNCNFPADDIVEQLSNSYISRVTTDKKFGWETDSAGLTWVTRASYNATRVQTEGNIDTIRNQDLCEKWPQLNGVPGQLLMIMLDGHGPEGTNFSASTLKHLHHEISTHPTTKNVTSSDSDIIRMLEEAFITADEKVENSGPGKGMKWTTEGACAAVTFIRNNTAFVAHAGDCQVPAVF